MKGVRLTIEQNAGCQMVEAVLCRYRGAIELAFRNEPSFPAFIFAAPKWMKIQGELFPVDAFFTIIIQQPERWKLVRNLRAQYGLEGDSIVYALFPPDFISRLHKSIRQAAALKALEGQVADARIEFSSTSPEGFKIAAVSVCIGSGRAKT
jgi:hypothetical protein